MAKGISALFLTTTLLLLVSLALYVDARSTLRPEVQFGSLCDSCLEISREVEKYLTDPDLPKQISGFYKDACHILPSNLQVKCVEMLEEYSGQALSFLQAVFAEQNLCNSTGLCGKDEEVSKTEQTDKDRKFSELRKELQVHFTIPDGFISKMSDDKGCAACNAALNKFNEDLENPEVKIKVIRILFKACEHVENNKKQCRKMVLEYGLMFLSYLEKYLKKNDPCRLLHICEAPAENTLVTPESFIPLLEMPTKQLSQPLMFSK